MHDRPPTLPIGGGGPVRDSAYAVAGEVGMPDFWTSLYQPSARRTGGTPVGGCDGGWGRLASALWVWKGLYEVSSFCRIS